MAKTFLCRVAEVPAGALREVVLGPEKKVCVINAHDAFFACQAHCPHQGAALCQGALDGTTLTCLDHLWQWDLRSGAPLGLAEDPLPMLQVEVDGDSLYLKD
jgi:toluene monooxygenase system ferredoxin subunit